MSPPRSARKPLKLLTEIRRDLAEVDKICIDWENGTNSEDEERVGALIECAFENSLVLMETIGRAETRNHVSALFDRARKNLTKSAYSVNASEVYSVWSWQLSNILNAVEKVDFGLAKDVEEPIDLIIRVLDRMGSVECLVQRLRDRESKSIRNNGPVIVSGDPPDPEGSLECKPGSPSSAPSPVGQPEATAVYGDF